MQAQSTISRLIKLALSSGALLAAMAAPATAVPLLDGFGGAAGYGELAMLGNDDGSSNQLNLPFTINFFGNSYNNFYINNNGNVTFGGSVAEYTPQSFPFNRPVAPVPGGGDGLIIPTSESGAPISPTLQAAATTTAPYIAMIAPYWGDVDTRCSGCGGVYVASPSADTVVVTWNNVGYYSVQNDKTNNFQLILKDQSAGNFDIAFRYDRLEWTTGSASGGVGGLGGTPAQAGFDAGDGINFFTIPGSQTGAVLNLASTTNVAGGPAGLWTFAIRAGAVPGTTADNPLMPVTTDNAWNFDFRVVLNQQIFIDPAIAVGYDYVVSSGPNIRSVLLPTGIGDNLFELWLWDGSQWYNTFTQISGGIEYFFGGAGVDRFRILGIEADAGLDPLNPTAFVTGLTFEGDGRVQMSMTALTNLTTGAAVPEPSILIMMLTGIAGLMASRRGSRTRAIA